MIGDVEATTGWGCGWGIEGQRGKAGRMTGQLRQRQREGKTALLGLACGPPGGREGRLGDRSAMEGDEEVAEGSCAGMEDTGQKGASSLSALRLPVVLLHRL
jgi:hypothetical protein